MHLTPPRGVLRPATRLAESVVSLLPPADTFSPQPRWGVGLSCAHQWCPVHRSRRAADGTRDKAKTHRWGSCEPSPKLTGGWHLRQLLGQLTKHPADITPLTGRAKSTKIHPHSFPPFLLPLQSCCRTLAVAPQDTTVVTLLTLSHLPNHQTKRKPKDVSPKPPLPRALLHLVEEHPAHP